METVSLLLEAVPEKAVGAEFIVMTEPLAEAKTPRLLIVLLMLLARFEAVVATVSPDATV
jgi:hypothetical protein